MKQHAKLFSGLFAAFAMALLILDARAALLGATEGIQLCLRTVVPALFPFFIFSISLTASLTGSAVPGLRPLGRLCGIPAGSEALLLTGFLGGYPVGAQCVCQAYEAGQLSAQDGKRMLGFCSNAGPAFLFGMLPPLFSTADPVWALWGIHILSALITAWLLPGKSKGSCSNLPGSPLTLPQALPRAVSAMAVVCGWVVLFRVFLVICRRWWLWLLPPAGQVVVTGLLELTNGCCQLSSLPSEGLRFLLCACFLGFGGSCVAMQTLSVSGKLGLGLYLPGKCLRLLISLLLASLAQPLLFVPGNRAAVSLPLLTLCLGIVLLFPLFLKKAVANRRYPVYNGENITSYEVILCCFVKKCPVPAVIVPMAPSWTADRCSAPRREWSAVRIAATNSATIPANGFLPKPRPWILKNTIRKITACNASGRRNYADLFRQNAAHFF